MANKYSKVNLQNKTNNEAQQSDLRQYEEKRKNIDKGARIMAIVVIVAMLVTSFLAAGLFLFD